MPHVTQALGTHMLFPMNLWDLFIKAFLFADEETMKYGDSWILPKLRSETRSLVSQANTRLL